MIKELSYEIIEAMLDTLPVEISFVDKDDTVRYFNKEGRRIFPRTRAIIGRKVQIRRTIHKSMLKCKATNLHSTLKYVKPKHSSVSMVYTMVDKPYFLHFLSTVSISIN